MRPNCTSHSHRRMATRQWIARLLLQVSISCSLVVSVAGCAAGDEPANGTSDTRTEGRAAPDPAPSPAQAAAIRGIDYLLSRAEQTSPAWKYRVCGLLTKIAPSEEYARRLREQANIGLNDRTSTLPARFEEKDLRWPRNFRKWLEELDRRKARDDDWRTPVAQLQRLLDRHEDVLFASMQPTQQLVTLHDFAKLGIHTRYRTEDVVRALRARWAVEDHRALVNDSGFMFAVTHVVYVASEYLDHPLDPGSYAPEVEVLETAAAQYAASFPDAPFFLDVAGEVLVARKVLGLPETDASRRLSQALIERQSPEGRWGPAQSNRDLHATLVMVQALIDFPERFRRPAS